MSQLLGYHGVGEFLVVLFPFLLKNIIIQRTQHMKTAHVKEHSRNSFKRQGSEIAQTGTLRMSPMKNNVNDCKQLHNTDW